MSKRPSKRRKPNALVRALDKVRARHLLMKLSEYPFLLIASIATAAILQALADYVFNLPWAARAVLLILDLAGIGWLTWKYLICPWMKRLDRKGAALLVERRIPEFRSALISSYEFSLPDAEIMPESLPLVQDLVDQTNTELKRVRELKRIIHSDRVKRFAIWMLAPLVIMIGLYVFCQPISSLLVQRILLSNDKLPVETEVVTLSGNILAEEGDEVTLSARATGKIPSEGRLIIIKDGEDPQTIPIFLTKPGAAEFYQKIKNVREPFSYRFELNDGVGEEYAVSVHIPPAVKQVKFTQEFPSYTGLSDKEMHATSLKLMAGSKLRIEGSATKPISLGYLTIQRSEGVDANKPFTPKSGGTRFTTGIGPVPAKGWESITLKLKGTDDDLSTKDPVYPIQMMADRPPLVSILSPTSSSLTLVVTDSVPIRTEVSDDFGITSLTLYYRILRPGRKGELENAQSGRIRFTLKGAPRAAAKSLNWKLSTMRPALTEGCQVIYWIEAKDNNPNAVPPADREKSSDFGYASSRTTERTVRIVSEAQKRIELLEEFGRKAQEIEQLYETQRRINDRTNAPLK